MTKAALSQHEQMTQAARLSEHEHMPKAASYHCDTYDQGRKLSISEHQHHLVSMSMTHIVTRIVLRPQGIWW